jgi:cysteine synthase
MGELKLINKIFADDRFKLFDKIEGMNPGGSIKDRSGLHTLEKYFD